MPVLKKEERSQIKTLTLHFKGLETEEQTKSKAGKRKEIINIRAQINKTENEKNNKGNQWNKKKVFFSLKRLQN